MSRNGWTDTAGATTVGASANAAVGATTPPAARGRRTVQLTGAPRTAPAAGRQSTTLSRAGRWWLDHWLRFAEVVGPQWR